VEKRGRALSAHITPRACDACLPATRAGDPYTHPGAAALAPARAAAGAAGPWAAAGAAAPGRARSSAGDLTPAPSGAAFSSPFAAFAAAAAAGAGVGGGRPGGAGHASPARARRRRSSTRMPCGWTLRGRAALPPRLVAMRRAARPPRPAAAARRGPPQTLRGRPTLRGRARGQARGCAWRPRWRRRCACCRGGGPRVRACAGSARARRRRRAARPALARPRATGRARTPGRAAGTPARGAATACRPTGPKTWAGMRRARTQGPQSCTARSLPCGAAPRARCRSCTIHKWHKGSWNTSEQRSRPCRRAHIVGGFACASTPCATLTSRARAPDVAGLPDLHPAGSGLGQPLHSHARPPAWA